uniref:Uncharacterized protein n=1 Tax=Strigops habroptila TaxID=2489341 RepID=A0A672THA9_STRHB
QMDLISEVVHGICNKSSVNVSISGRELVSFPEQVFGLYQMDLLPQDISCLQHLTCLYVDSNNLKTIPAEIGNLSHLERLTLSNNSLSSLPPEMGALQRLCSCHLANNSLTELPAPLCQLRSLTFPDMSDNRIGTVPSKSRSIIIKGFISVSLWKSAETPFCFILLSPPLSLSSAFSSHLCLALLFVGVFSVATPSEIIFAFNYILITSLSFSCKCFS